MVFAKKTLLLTLLTVLPIPSLSFKIPQGQGDGIFLHEVDKDGQPMHRKIGNLVDLNMTVTSSDVNMTAYKPSAKFRRDGTAPIPSSASVGCDSGYVTSYDYASAFASLNKICGTMFAVARKQNIYVTSGAATAYMCNYGGENNCQSRQVAQAFSAIQSQCPNNLAGHDYIRVWAKQYGYQTIQANICS